MNKLTILVDLDDVLWDLVSPWVAAINKIYGTSVSSRDITDWEIVRFFPSLTKEQVGAPLFIKGFWDGMQPEAGGQWFIRQLLEDGHKIKIVTATLCENVPEKMKRLFELNPMLTWDDVVITSEKQSIKGDVMIDDAPHNLMGGNWMKILYSRPHNYKFEADKNGMFRIETLGEAYTKISALVNN